MPLGYQQKYWTGLWCRPEVDHMTEWQQDGGRTDTENAVIGCKHHNLIKHHKKFRAHRQSDGQIIYHRPDGTPILPIGQQPPPQTEEQLQNQHIKQRLKTLRQKRITRDKQLESGTADI